MPDFQRFAAMPQVATDRAVTRPSPWAERQPDAAPEARPRAWSDARPEARPDRQTPLPALDRRRCLRLASAAGVAAGAGAAGLAAVAPPARAEAPAARYTQAQLVGLALASEGVEVVLPELADNSNAIPLSFSLQAPPGRLLRGFEIVAPENPNPLILRWSLNQGQPRFRFSTRIRLAMTQSVWVLMALDDGTRRGKAAPTVVTATACFDET